MVDFDALNRATSHFKNCEEPSQPWFWSQGTGLSARERIADENNRTFKSNNGCWPDRPFSSTGGTYSTGKRY